MWLAILLAINSVIAAYYYLRVVMAMYFREGQSDWTPQPMPIAVVLVLLITAVGTLYLGLFPGLVMSYATHGALSLR